MQAASNRTFICSVVFLDIVGYSKKPVTEQIQLKERLNTLLTEALANVAPNDRIILDTGDGAALSFIGDPEDALFVGLTLRDALATPLPHGPHLPLRLGINLGPVKLVKDINGQPNIIGDGINVAQRVMSFAEPGQVLVSRSYYEVVSCLSEDYVKLFHYEGSRTDKHVREHEVYAVQATGDALSHIVASSESRKKAAATHSGTIDALSVSASVVTENVKRRPLLTTAATVAAILSVAIAIRANRPPSVSPPMASAPAKVASAPAPAPAPVASREAEKSTPPVKAKDKTVAPAKKAAATTQQPPASVSTPAKGTPESTPAANTPAETARPAAAVGTGMIRLTISPWGEIYVDGVHKGDTPPLYELNVGAGRHRVEIRHPDFPTHVRTVDVAAGARVDVRHVFLPQERPNPLRDVLPWK